MQCMAADGLAEGSLAAALPVGAAPKVRSLQAAGLRDIQDPRVQCAVRHAG
jgi:hypothetical protein